MSGTYYSPLPQGQVEDLVPEAVVLLGAIGAQLNIQTLLAQLRIPAMSFYFVPQRPWPGSSQVEDCVAAGIFKRSMNTYMFKTRFANEIAMRKCPIPNGMNNRQGGYRIKKEYDHPQVDANFALKCAST